MNVIDMTERAAAREELAVPAAIRAGDWSVLGEHAAEFAEMLARARDIPPVPPPRQRARHLRAVQ